MVYLVCVWQHFCYNWTQFWVVQYLWCLASLTRGQVSGTLSLCICWVMPVLEPNGSLRLVSFPSRTLLVMFWTISESDQADWSSHKLNSRLIYAPSRDTPNANSPPVLFVELQKIDICELWVTRIHQWAILPWPRDPARSIGGIVIWVRVPSLSVTHNIPFAPAQTTSPGLRSPKHFRAARLGVCSYFSSFCE